MCECSGTEAAILCRSPSASSVLRGLSRQADVVVFALTLLGWCTSSMVVGLALGRVFALRKDEASDIAAPAELPELTAQG